MAYETEGKELSNEALSAGVRYLLNHPEHGFYVVAEIDGEVAGSLMVTYEWSDWRNGVIWWIQSVYVRPEYRRRGVYRSLYAEVKKMAAAQKNVCGFRLYVEKRNTAAQRTYAALGMHEANYKFYEEMPDE
ncbi:GNAT family N-acetyltransferase [bacterium]|nr:GNAT family N-acetyltransferase [bacterium]